MTMLRRWKAVVGFEGLYEVSDFGRVRSLDRVVEYKNRWGSTTRRLQKGCVLRQSTNKARRGYRYVNLHADLKQHQRRVACLVAAAFLGPRPIGAQVCHNNNIPSDDRCVNLRYDTPKGNSSDQLRFDTRVRGEKHPAAQLSVEEILRIRRNASGATQKALADQYMVSAAHIGNIQNRKRWRHV